MEVPAITRQDLSVEFIGLYDNHILAGYSHSIEIQE
jgi:hypothetical protein